jgi:hypothetical protein
MRGDPGISRGSEKRRRKMLRQVGNQRILLLLVVILTGSWLWGCSSLCTKRLYLYRDTPEKRQAPAHMALLICNPKIAAAVLSRPGGFPGVSQWAPEQPSYESDYYQVSIEGLDGGSIYQGLCMDITPTYVCEVKPGWRQVRVKLELFGPWGRESKKEEVKLDLKPGRCYFLRPDWDQLQNKNFVLKVEPLPEAYTPALRARVVDWERKNSTGRSLTD